jgi:hypothetical protein
MDFVKKEEKGKSREESSWFSSLSSHDLIIGVDSEIRSREEWKEITAGDEKKRSNTD